MKIEIAEHGRMTESGSSLLRLIQNQDIPLLDLLVRESVQNSLDATTKTFDKVEVDMLVGDFKPVDLNRYFDKIGNGLDRRYHSKSEKFIAVKDSKTVGLTGPVRYSEVKNNVFGNLLKLVYEICKPQSDEGAGGSWGLGKTIYFRLGIGLVIYYSRIFQNGKYQSRLAACLVENETKADALIPYNKGVKRGIAWWGQKDKFLTNATIPLDDDYEIGKILNVFGIAPYGKNETGTTIIIPYIDEKALLDEVYEKNESVADRPYWAGDLAEYLKVSLQRWYAPRLNNAKYPYGAYLSASVNGERLRTSSMLPLFRYIRELYILGTTGNVDEESLINETQVDFHVESIDLRGVLATTSSGKFAYAKFSRQQLQMEPPVNQKTPYQQIMNIPILMDGGNGPIMAYTRRPGMIVGYDYDGTWTHRMPKSGPDEYVIGLFVLNSGNTLKNVLDSKTEKQMTLEEYIRQGEKADHASWTDRNIFGNNPRIITNIQKNVIGKIKKQYSEPVRETYERQNVGLSHALANMLLPESDFGTMANPPAVPGGEKKPPRATNGRKSAIHIYGVPRYTDGTVQYDFEMLLKGKTCTLMLQVLTDFKRYHANLWESDDEIGREFPLEFQELKIMQIQKVPKAKNKPVNGDALITQENPRASIENISFEFKNSKVFSTCSYISIKPTDGSYTVTGSLSFSFRDPGLKGICELKETADE